MFAKFDESQKEVLKGHATGIGKKHGCSPAYVRLIVRNKREVNTPLAKKIVHDLNALAAFFTPQNNNK